MDSTDTTGSRPRGDRHRWAPLLALLALAPWTAECSWGGFPVSEYPVVILFLAPLYGGAAILIREVARRTGGGWPAIVLLAGAFGVMQAALVDQAVFNPGFLDDTEYADSASASTVTLVRPFGFSAEQAFTYVGNHVLLSICAPIMLVETALRPPHRHRPWTTKRGLLGFTVLYLLGSLMIFMDDEAGRKGFMLSPVQAALAATTVLTLASAAMLPRWRRPRDRRPGYTPHPLLFGLLALAAHLGPWFTSGWLTVGIRAGAALSLMTLTTIWSRRRGWTQRHVVAGWSTGLTAAAAGATLSPAYEPTSPLLSLLSDIAVVAVTVASVVTAYRWAAVRDAARGCGGSRRQGVGMLSRR